MTRKSGCIVCDTVAPGDLVELDMILADPTTWPSTVWNGFTPPPGQLPASYRRFGQQEMGIRFLEQHEYSITKPQLRHHIRYDVPVFEVNITELVERGVIAAADHRTAVPSKVLSEPIDPLAYVKFYNDGIRLGQHGLELLAQRVEKLTEEGVEVPMAVIKMLIDNGLKLASSQAAIRSAGKRMDGDADDELDAFRTGQQENQASPRIGHHRVRKIAGESRPVVDQGPGDREDYNETARANGQQEIGGRR